MSSATPARPDYKTHDPKGWGGDPRRGAALGRRAWREEDGETYAGRLYLRRVYLNGDYDSNGTYWGSGGDPLYWCANAEGTIDFVFRARDRSAAIAHVREHFYPHAKFYGERKPHEAYPKR